ncbi:papain-like cysteine protease family protein [Streptomyces mirabilis]
MQQQRQSNWCWAATTASVAAFYNPETSWTQCTVANKVLGLADCCSYGGGNPCNVEHNLNQPLADVGCLDSWFRGRYAWSELPQGLSGECPLCLHITWSGGGGHFVTITGYNSAHQDVFVADAFYGPSDISYNTLCTAYQGGGTWDETYRTRYP